MGKKSKPRYQPDTPQTIMRREMTAPKKLRTLADRDRAIEAERETKKRDRLYEADPRPLGTVLDEVVGPEQELASVISRYGQQQRRAKDIVYDIINEHELVLSLKQWQTVQSMMEQAVMTGVQLEIDFLES